MGYNCAHHWPTSLCKWRDHTTGCFVHWLCNYHSECFIIQSIWCWRLKNSNWDWICDNCVSSSSYGVISIPLPNTTISSRTKRFSVEELYTHYVYGGHPHFSSIKVEFCGDKIPGSTRCSRLRPNLHLKDSANDNYGFCVWSIVLLSLSQWSGKYIIGLYIFSDGTAHIRWRHRKRMFQLFESCIFVKRTHTNLNNPNIFPLRYKGMMIHNNPI